MTPKEKAILLVNRFYATLLRNDHLQSYNASKECALISVDEIINEPAYADSGSIYWQQVKQEIENL